MVKEAPLVEHFSEKKHNFKFAVINSYSVNFLDNIFIRNYSRKKPIGYSN